MTDSQPPEASPTQFGAIVARLTGVNFLIVVLAFVTAPILARALGPSGRGEVAAVFAVLGIAPWISELGMTAFLSREHARRTYPLGVLLGSTMPIALAASLVGVALAVPLAHLLGRGRPVVIDFIEIGLFLLPLSACVQMLVGVALGDQRWGVMMLTRVLSAGGIAIAIVSLRLLDAVAVPTVAATYLVFAIVANVPLLVMLRGSRPWRFVRPLASTGLAFGVRSWLSTLAGTGNAYIDQVLMAGLVSSRQLGLYALAVTLSNATNSLVSATMSALFPRVAAGESHLAAHACRVTLVLVVVLGAGIAATSPVFVPIVFGRAFADMIPMLVVLLAASAFNVPAQVLGAALVAGGNPAATARAQLVGLVITVPALLVVLPRAGGIGAAWVSLAAYAATFAIILWSSARTFALPYRALLVITGRDLRWLWAGVRRRRPARSTNTAAVDEPDPEPL